MSAAIPPALVHRDTVKCKPKGKYIGNRRCHANALSYALRHTNVTKIVGVVQVFSDHTCVAHFVVKLNDGTYLDPTYGNMSGVLDNYVIPVEEYEITSFSPDRELINLQEYLFNLRSFWYRLCRSNPY